MNNPHLLVRTFRNGSMVSRLAEFRLKLAARERDNAIDEAHERYAEQVRALLGKNHFDASYALRRGVPANSFCWAWLRALRMRRVTAPSLASPYAHGLSSVRNLVDPAELLTRHGYRRASRSDRP